MDARAEPDKTDDVQTQVLQTTLSEIETSRRAPTGDDHDAAAASHDCCVICLDTISEPCAASPCGHAHFDFLCLVSWLQQHPNCPLCKANVYKVRYADAQQGDAVYRVPNAARARRGTSRDERDARRTGQTALQSHLDSVSRRSFASGNGLLREADRRGTRAPPSPSEAIQRRRHIYRHQLYSLHIGSNRISQYRPPPTPVQFSSTPHLVSRARLWIRRELQVFSFLSDPELVDGAIPTPTPRQHRVAPAATAAEHEESGGPLLHRRRNNAEFLLEYVVAILKTVDLQGSAGEAEAMLADFLGRAHARLFLHELRAWLRSPASSLASWDREVQYPCPPEPGPGSNLGSAPGCGSEARGEQRIGRSSSSISSVNRRGTVFDAGNRESEVEQRGRTWRDRGGDHWRRDALVRTSTKRKAREGDLDVDVSMASRTRRAVESER